MAENTKISWATHTFNPWEGCTRISPACDHCYAADRAHRFGNDHLWSGQLRRTSPANWRKPLTWNREAANAAEPVTVFCASLSDVFDNQAPQEWRDDLWQLIEATPNLRWKLLTKRPQNVAKMLPATWMKGDAPTNAMLGITAEDQERLDQRGFLAIAIGSALGWDTFVSAEPLLERLDFTRIKIPGTQPGWINALTGVVGQFALTEFGGQVMLVGSADKGYRPFAEIYSGGESGPKARLHHPDWHRKIRDDCRAAGVRYHFKQWGEWIEVDQHTGPLRAHTAFVTTAGEQRGRQHASKGDALMIRAGARADPILDGQLHGELAEVVWAGIDLASDAQVTLTEEWAKANLDFGQVLNVQALQAPDIAICSQGRELLRINRRGEVLAADLEDASEAGRVFVESLRHYLTALVSNG